MSSCLHSKHYAHPRQLRLRFLQVVQYPPKETHCSLIVAHTLKVKMTAAFLERHRKPVATSISNKHQRLVRVQQHYTCGKATGKLIVKLGYTQTYRQDSAVMLVKSDVDRHLENSVALFSHQLFHLILKRLFDN